MDAETAQDIVQVTCAAHNAAEPLRRYLESEADALLRTLRFWVFKAGLARGADVEILAMEVLSIVTVEALKGASRFDPSRSPKSWLLGIAANVIKRLQKERVEQAEHVITVSALEGDADDPERDSAIFDRIADLSASAPEGAALSSERVESLLALVSPDDRHVLQLAILEELDGAALGRALGVAPGTARVQLYRALKRLRTAHYAATQEEEGRNG